MSVSRIEELLMEWNIQTDETVDTENEQLSNDNIKPWERSKRFHKEDVNGKLSITVSNLLYIKSDNLKPRLQNQIRRLAAFSNPVFFKNNAIGLSN